MTSPGEDYALDLSKPGWVAWSSMGARERWGACLLAMRNGWPLATSSMAYHPRLDVVALVRESPFGSGRNQAAHRRVTTAELAREEVRMLFGARGVEDVERLVGRRRGAMDRALVILLLAGSFLAVAGSVALALMALIARGR